MSRYPFRSPTPSASTAGRTMQESVYKRRVEPRRLPEDAPNILIVLIDDAGPALPTTFGGEVHTPTLDRIAKEGIAYNRFHTTAMCSPTRASLLTGRNHHRVGNGQIAELANDWDGYSGTIPKSSAPAAEVLKDYGYATAAFGKWHNTPAERDHRRRPVRQLAHGLRLRVLLRVPRRRGLAVRAEPGAQHDQRRAAPDARGRLSPERGPRRRRDRLAAPAQGASSRTSRSSCTGRAARSTARTTSRRSGPTSTRASSTTAGTPTASASSSAPRRRAGFPPDAQLTPRRSDHAGLGQHSRGREAFPAPPDGSLRRVHASTSTCRSAGSSTRSSGSATATTR